MKKLVLTLVMGVFAFTSNAQTLQASEGPSQDCLNAAWDYVDDFMARDDVYYVSNRAQFAMMEAYIEEYC